MLLNGSPAELDHPLRDGDVLQVEPAEEPSPPEATVRDVLPPLAPLTLVLEGEEKRLEPLLLVNGEPATPDYRLQDRDEVEVRPCRTVGEALRAAGVDPGPGIRLVLSVNGRGDRKSVV